MKRKSPTARSRTAAAAAHNSILSDPVPPDQTSSLFRIVSQEPISAAPLLSSSPSNGADSPCWHRTYPRRFPRPRNALASAARAKLQRNRQRKGVSKASSPQFNHCGSPKPSPRGTRGVTWWERTLLAAARRPGRRAGCRRRTVLGRKPGWWSPWRCWYHRRLCRSPGRAGCRLGGQLGRCNLEQTTAPSCHCSARFGLSRSCGQFLRPRLQM